MLKPFGSFFVEAFMMGVMLVLYLFRSKSEEGITDEMVMRFVGGWMEVRNTAEGYAFHGPIRSISLEGDELLIICTYLAFDGCPPSRGLGHMVDLRSFQVWLESGTRGRICLRLKQKGVLPGEIVLLTSR